MTFNIINAGDPGLASTAMQNWRHVNYGNALIPVNSSGSGVNNTIDFGSSSFAWKDGYFAGNLTVDTNTFFVDATNNRIGVGTITPDSNLEISSSGTTTVEIDGGATGSPTLKMAQNSVDKLWLFFDNATGAIGLNQNAGSTSGLHIDSSNNIGINTASPLETLDVRGNVAIGSELNFDMVTNANSNGWINYNGYQSGTTQFRDLTIGDGKQNAIAFFDGSTGYFGVGTTGPDRPLDVLSTAGPQIRATYTDGSAYTDIETNGSGNTIITNTGTYVQYGNTNYTRIGPGSITNTQSDGAGFSLGAGGYSFTSIDTSADIEQDFSARNVSDATVTAQFTFSADEPRFTLNRDLFFVTNFTEDFGIKDAGSTGATEQDWIEVSVGGNTGYIRVFATK